MRSESPLFWAAEVARSQQSPLPGNSPNGRTLQGRVVIVTRELASIPSPATPLPSGNTKARIAFSQAPRNLSVRCGFKTKTKTKTKTIYNPGRGAASRWSAPGPGKRTRRKERAPLIVRDEFRTGYSLIGLLASRARLRFTGTARIKLWTAQRKQIIIER